MKKLCLFILFTGVIGAPSNIEEMEFFRNYGLMGEKQVAGLSNAVRKFQEMVGLEVTGYIDAQVKNAMNAPRCGMASKLMLLDSKWSIENVTYKIVQYPEIPTDINIDDIIQRAFDTWADTTNLRFKPRKRNFKIEIKFVKDKHGDDFAFDGPYNVIGHALPPSGGGSIHFDSDETWSLDDSGVNLYQCALHEIGHSLGLGHNYNMVSVMSPFLITYRENFTLPEIDVEAIQMLYQQRNSSFVKETPCSSCVSHRFNTVFRNSKKVTYVFVEDKYLQFNENMKLVKTALIRDKWKNLPSNIDAVTETKKGNMLFFKGNQYWKYTGQIVDKDYPKFLKTFYGVPDNIEAILRWNKQYIFFQGKDIYKYTPGGKSSAIKSTIKEEFDIDTNFINAAVVVDKSILFFKSTTYFEYNLDTKTSTKKNINDYFNC